MGQINFNDIEVTGENILIGEKSVALCNSDGMICRLWLLKSDKPIRVKIEGDVNLIEVTKNIRVFGNIDLAETKQNCFHIGSCETLKFGGEKEERRYLKISTPEEEREMFKKKVLDYYHNETSYSEEEITGFIEDLKLNDIQTFDGQLISITGFTNKISILTTSFSFKYPEIVVHGNIKKCICENLYIEGNIKECHTNKNYIYKEKKV